MQREPELLVALIQLREDRHNENAWGDLFALSWALISATAMRELRGVVEAVEDVRQQVFLKLCTDSNFPGEIDSAARYHAYLSAITRNTCIDYWRQMSRRA